MPTLTIHHRGEAERLALEQAIAYVAHWHQRALSAPDGSVLAAWEQLALRDGRALLPSTLAAALRGRITAAEQKGGAARLGPEAHPGRPKGRHPRTVQHPPGARGLLDIYHGAGYVWGGAKAVLGGGSAWARAPAERGRLRLLEDGCWGVTEWVGGLARAMPAGGGGAALGGVPNSFAGPQGRRG
jgi:hypothetical protein